MNLYVKNHNFHFELENLTRLFFPNEKITVIRDFSEPQPPYIYTEVSDKITISVNIGSLPCGYGFEVSDSYFPDFRVRDSVCFF